MGLPLGFGLPAEVGAELGLGADEVGSGELLGGGLGGGLDGFEGRGGW